MQTEDISATESSCAVAERDVPVDKLEAAGSSQAASQPDSLPSPLHLPKVGEEGVVPIAQEPSSEGESDSRHQDESEDFLGPNSLGIRSVTSLRNGEASAIAEKTVSDNSSDDALPLLQRDGVGFKPQKPAAGLKVTFHALLHPEWKFEENDKRVYIQFESNLREISMKVQGSIPSLDGKSKFFKLCGSTVLPIAVTRDSIFYKYTIKKQRKLKKSKVEPEFIVAPRSCGGYLFRILVLPPELRGNCKGHFVKYDDVVHRWTPDTGRSRDVFVDSRKLAIGEFLPKWQGFYCASDVFLEPMLACEALTRLESVVNQLQQLSVRESIWHLRDWNPEEMNVAMILCDILKPKLEQLKSFKPTCKEKAAEKVVSAAAIAIVVKKHRIGLELSNDHLKSLAHSFSLEQSYYDAIKDTIQKNFSSIREITDALCNICSELCFKSYPTTEWIFSLPLIHFLSDLTKPFNLPCNVSFEQDEWWGLGELKEAISAFQKNENSASLLDIREQIEPLFETDPLLFRVIIFASPYDEAKFWITSASLLSEGVAAVIKKALRIGDSAEVKISLVTFLEGFFEILRKEDLHFLKCADIENVCNSTTDTRSISHVIDSTKMGIRACLTLLAEFSKHLPREQDRVLFDTLNLLFEQHHALEGSDYTEVEVVANICASWIESVSSHHDFCSDLKLWNKMFCYGTVLKSDEVCYWNFRLKSRFEKQFPNLNNEQKLAAYKSIKNNSFCSLVEECLIDLSRSAVEQLIQSQGDLESSFHCFFYTAKGTAECSVLHSRRCLSDILSSKSPAFEASDSAWLANIFQSSLWKRYLRLCGDEELFPDENSDVVLRMLKAKRVIVNFLGQIASATVSVADLELAKANIQQLDALCAILDEQNSKHPPIERKRSSLQQITEGALHLRIQELERFDKEKKLVLNFLSTCQSLAGKVDFQRLRDFSKIDVSEISLNKLVRRLEDGSIDVVYFDCLPKVKHYMKPLNELQKSLVFHRLLRDKKNVLERDCKGNEDTETVPMALNRVIQLVIEPVFRAWKKVCELVKSGEIKLKEVKDNFKLLSYSSEKLREELSYMDLDSDNSGRLLAERVRQICLYKTLSKSAVAAKAVRCVCAELHVSKPLVALSEICSLDSQLLQGQPLLVMNAAMMSAGSFLEAMEEEQIVCLQMFADCGPLIDWVKRDLKEWTELETFVELAGTLCSTEGDFGAFKVVHLRASCAGYATLLFNLSEEANLDQLFGACRGVFEQLKRDQKLPQKWCDTQKYLADFKLMKVSLGSVEVSSFSEVEAINSYGEYLVGYQGDRSLAKDIGDFIELIVRPSVAERKGGRTKYNLFALQDLESKLILISGHGSERQSEVNVFRSTLEYIIQLAAELLDLHKAGHAKYRSWRRSFCCISPLQHDNEYSADKSRQLEQFWGELKKVKTEMTSDLKLWKAEIRRLRSNYYYLNYFTTEQLLKLTEHLGHLVARGTKLPNDIYALLECIKPNINEKDVSETVEKTCSKSSPRLQNQEADLSSTGGSLARTSPLGGRHSAGSLRSLKRHPWGGFASPVHFESLSANEFSQPQQKSESGTPVMSIDNPQYLAFERLGEFLRALAKRTPPSLPRSFPCNQLKLGHPNLILVPRSDLLSTVLRVYMTDRDLPLPSAEEVLLCSPETTFETVLLFWRRAIKDPTQGRLFCLVGADRLSYEVSREAVDELFKLSQGLSGEFGESFRLVVICCAENEDKSYFVSSLERYRRPPLSCPSRQEVQSYLKDQFRNGPSELKLCTTMGTAWTPAADQLDDEQSCVRVVYSTRAGVGKSLFVSSVAAKLAHIPNNRQAKIYYSVEDEKLVTKIIVPLHDSVVDSDAIMEVLESFFPHPDQTLSRLIHFDISPSVRKGLDEFLFNFVVLGQINDSKGRVWRRRLTDMHIFECTWPEEQDTLIKRGSTTRNQKHVPFEAFLPAIRCRSPRELLDLSKSQKSVGFFDETRFQDLNFQRPFQYLVRLSRKEDLERFKFNRDKIEGTRIMCLKTFTDHCGVFDPSWAMLSHFASFLNNHLCDYEQNDFCSEAAGLPGFKIFVLRLIIVMSRDFSTPSLDDGTLREEVNSLQQYQLRRRWEHHSHSYLFFNEDRHSTTPFNLYTRNNRLINPRTETELDKELTVSNDLIRALLYQKFPLHVSADEWPNLKVDAGYEWLKKNIVINYDELSKTKKIEILCSVMGLPHVPERDPDQSYDLTTDNMIKILAIHMRFRCSIPVVVMGETGCGKTRLIRFMCLLQAQSKDVQNFILVKVHGGLTQSDIRKRVSQAEQCAVENARNKVKTVLFFDEANTTDAVGLIKELMCDGRMNGRSVHGLGTNLHVIAACNPYRKHTNVMIQKLESAGLGYHVRPNNTEDRLGDIPLRQLVYRVHPLPESMKALVWDFGQLSPDTERSYIFQIVKRHAENGSLPSKPGLIDVTTAVLACSQSFMRARDDECSYVSLRDVERAMLIMVWFYKLHDVLDPFMKRKYEENKNNEEEASPLDAVTRSLVLSIGVSYQARLVDRAPYRDAVCSCFKAPCALPVSSSQMWREIDFCQTVFLDELDLPPKIGRNHALKENVFMMVVCVDLRIPLFLVGKPGSSKSLAKDVVKNSMRGEQSNSKLYRHLKQIHMISYQCSALSTADGIISTFDQCQRVQKENGLDRFVACVVLDEVGLAEDSPRLPLKALHPLLDDGTTGADTDKHQQRVAFVGLSNWALDPAKMNRGILVQRNVPMSDELVISARGICSADEETELLLQPFFHGLAEAYLEIYGQPEKRGKRDFFGLRDFYSLVKMIFSFCKMTKRPPSNSQLLHAIRRNFGGYIDFDPVRFFRSYLPFNSDDDALNLDSSPVGLIRANLNKPKHNSAQSGVKSEGYLDESRYLLLLTENYAVLPIVRNQFLVEDENPVIIYGSSFPKDQEYTQLCRKINRVKVCMATGRTVILLNLDKLYESLYDALNQYYVYHGGQRFVDLGLGSHRVKCQVHKQFRLILIADREKVYTEFPIPLINRMEKHFLAFSSIFTKEQQEIVEEVERWVEAFSETTQVREDERATPFGPADSFVGYHSGAASTIVFGASRCLEQEGDDRLALGDDEWRKKLLSKSREILLQCATPDAVARLGYSRLSSQSRLLWDTYFVTQEHSSLTDYLSIQLKKEKESQLIQVTTHSKLLSGDAIRCLLPMGFKTIHQVIFLQQLDTEQQFCSRVEEFYSQSGDEDSLLVVVCESGDESGELVAYARYLVEEKRAEVFQKRGENGIFMASRHAVFLVHLSRTTGGHFERFQGGDWTEVHVDDLKPADDAKLLSIPSLVDRKISSLFGKTQTTADKRFSRDSPVPELEVAENVLEKKDISQKKEAVVSAASLFRSCVHAAISRLNDLPGSRQDATNERLDALLFLIPEAEPSPKGVCRFFDELKKKVISLLEERDSLFRNESDGEWVKNEALNLYSIQAGGTFRHSLWLKIVDVVTPILAELIAFIDADSNLLLLRKMADNYIGALWLKLFSCPQLFSLRYPFSHESNRVSVKGSGYKNHAFCAGFPFSRLVKEEVDGMMEKAKNLSEISIMGFVHCLSDLECWRLLSDLQQLFERSSVGKVVRECSFSAGDENLALIYLEDFVHMVCYPRSGNDFQLVFSAIKHHAIKLSTVGDSLLEEDSSLHCLTIPSIHVAYDRIKLRLGCFSDLLDLDEDVSCHWKLESLQDMDATDEFDEFAVINFLKSLMPKPCTLLSPRLRKAWLQRVQKAKPCLEAWFELPVKITLSTADISQKSFARNMWTKICVVRLYFEHTKPLESKTDFFTETGNRMFENFENSNLDFKTVETVELVAGFLNERSLECSEKLFGKNGVYCSVCGNAWIDKEPVLLSCKHIFCAQCIAKSMYDNASSCPLCKSPILCISSSDKLVENTRTFQFFRKCCTTFFMELVAVHSFNVYSFRANDSVEKPPQPALVRFLMDLVFQSQSEGEASATRSFSPLSVDAIDATPTVRSFLLQLLLRCPPTQECIDEHLHEYFDKTQNVFAGLTNSAIAQKAKEEFDVIFVQCFEDLIIETESLSLTGLLRYAENNLLNTYSLAHLKTVACARVGLYSVAKVILDILEKGELPSESETLAIELAQKLCTERHALIFLLKELVRRRRDLDVLTQLQNTDAYALTWLGKTVLQHSQSGKDVAPDYFIVIGKIYKDMREAVARSILMESLLPMKEVIETSQVKVKAVIILLAMYREVTMRQAYADSTKHVSVKVQRLLEEYCHSAPGLPSWARENGLYIIKYTQTASRELPVLVSLKQSLQSRAIAALAFHVRLTIEASAEADDPLMKPFFYMMKDPSKLTDAYFPTMPGDQGIASGGTAWNQCANGHNYYFNSSSAFSSVQACSVCGAQSSGRQQQVKKQKSRKNGDTGHILGHAAAREGVGPAVERELSSSGCAIIRLLMHAALMWASCDGQHLLKSLLRIVKPAVLVDQLPQFFWDHFVKDVKAFAMAIGYDLNNAIVIIHWFLDVVVSKHQYVVVLKGKGTLKSAEERQDWEKNFACHFIDPALQELIRMRNVSDWMESVTNDRKDGTNPLIRWLYELDSPPGTTSSSSLWRYRVQVSVEHLAESLELHCKSSSDRRELRILRKFLRKEHNLNTLQFLPQVLQLQRMLQEKFHHRLSLRKALKTSISDFLHRIHSESERKVFSSLIEDFQSVWEYLRSEILRHGRLKPDKNDDKLEQVTEDTPLAFLLPTTSGKGVCAMSLVDYLINCVHNEFVSEFRSLSGLEGTGPIIPMREVARAYLISYDRERDLNPLIVANCTYSLEAGKGSEISYNYASLERQLIDRFLSGKRRLEFEPYTFVYSEDANSAEMFNKIQRKIPQEHLSSSVSRQIINELRDLTDVYSVLSVLDVLIGFISSTGPDKDCLVHEYLHKTLKMPEERGLVSATARRNCCLKHTLSLWRTLMVEKGKRLVASHGDFFEHLPDLFKKNMGESLLCRFLDALRRIDLDVFMHELVELAWLELKNMGDMQNLEDYSFKKALQNFRRSKLKGLNDIPDEVRLSHLLHCWRISVELQSNCSISHNISV
ncbi:E3 ubiquitin-protein ligase rnf213-alpha-like isoform X2 [Oscarella lobularis]|uniref:E3 ubiquitin-protein ligase rnf213-alpha-like isoform X2 n=1 Tax=Oscarella lobularis TaxID=121494 RepID=UPI003313D1A5